LQTAREGVERLHALQYLPIMLVLALLQPGLLDFLLRLVKGGDVN